MKVVVTGALGYSGKYIATRLLEAGHQVLTLTNSLHRPNPFGDRVQVSPFYFDQPKRLKETLRGAEVLVNTYWVRFDHRLFTHRQAVSHTRTMFEAARKAGLKRIVHTSITNPDPNSDLPYFRGKAELEEALKNLGISYCILRPTVLFGREDVLINNIAWALRRLPVFGIFGDGKYRLQPIYIEDFAAAAAVKAGERQNEIIEAIGPETFTYRELVATTARLLGLKRAIIGVPPGLGYWSCRLLGWLTRDVIITQQEIQGLMENRLYVDAPPLGKTRLTDWVSRHRESLGRKYTSEMARRLNRDAAYRAD